MHRLSGITCAILVFALPLSASASGFFETLGISFALNVQETKAAFARAGVKEFDFSKARLLETTVTKITGEMLSTLMSDLRADSVVFDTDFGDLPKPDCLYYENAVQKREDIALVAVCFFGKEERQVLIIPFFREGKIDSKTLRTYLHEEYGTEKRARSTTDLAIVRLWTERPWFHGGLLTRKYVFLFDMFQSEDKLPGISGFIAYVDAWNFANLRDDVKSEQVAKKAAAEKAKTDARKGL